VRLSTVWACIVQLKTFTTHSCPPLRYFCSLNVTVSHRLIQANDCVFSPSLLSSFGLPLPLTCLLLTVSEARSYFASTVIHAACKCVLGVAVLRRVSFTHDYSPNIIVYVRNSWLDECTVRATGKELKVTSDGGESGSKKYKRGFSGVCVLRESRVRRSVLCWWLESGCSRREDFLHLIFFLRDFINVVLPVRFSKIMRLVVGLLLFSTRKGSFLSTVTSHILR
jgi:hypothetical protein